jgi:hypothetical protein
MTTAIYQIFDDSSETDHHSDNKKRDSTPKPSLHLFDNFKSTNKPPLSEQEHCHPESVHTLQTATPTYLAICKKYSAQSSHFTQPHQNPKTSLTSKIPVPDPLLHEDSIQKNLPSPNSKKFSIQQLFQRQKKTAFALQRDMKPLRQFS